MEVILLNANQSYSIQEACVACIGYFDGIHIGHQKLIEETLKQSNKKNLIPAVICFDADPWILSHRVLSAHYITPFHKRMKLLEQYGIKRCYLLHFDDVMMNLNKDVFINDILKQLNIETLICGEDFRFGFKGEGTIDDLKNHIFSLFVISEISIDKKKVSSTYIEQLITQGNIKIVNKLLERAYQIDGTVIHGNHVGSTKLGFPTANLKLSDNFIIPKQGVYAGAVIVNNREYPAMINIGNNPTINYQEQISIEAHILSFNEDIYDSTVSFIFYEFIRDEKKFNELNELVEQLNKDVETVKKIRGVS